MAINFYSDIHLNANKIGRDADNLIDFSTDNEITLRTGASNGITIGPDTVTFTSANADDPAIIIENTTADNQAARLQFKKHRGVDAVDNDNVGEIEFWGYDDGTPSEQIYGKVAVAINDATSGEESGEMSLVVASHDGGQNRGLKLTGGSVDQEVDAVVGNGAASVTTIAGVLTVTTEATIPERRFLLSSTTDGNVGSGDIVYFGSGTVTIGKIYHYKSDGSWEAADANDVAKCDGLLGVATATGTATVVGMLLRGTITIVDIQGTEAVGDVLYLSESATGEADCVAPAGSADVVRIIGYCLSTDDQIWFNPSPDFIVLT